MTETTPVQERERERDLDRLLTFVDAIVAIAITLLVLPLVELTAEVGREEPVADLLRAHQADIWSFLLSFAVIAQLWGAQHRAVSHLLRDSPALNRLLVVWTLTIVFLPFPTALVAKTVDQPITKILYVGTIALSSLLIALIDLTIARNPGLTDGEAPDPLAALTATVLLGIALAIMLAVPDAGYYPMLLLFLGGPAHRLLLARRRRG